MLTLSCFLMSHLISVEPAVKSEWNHKSPEQGSYRGLLLIYGGTIEMYILFHFKSKDSFEACSILDQPHKNAAISSTFNLIELFHPISHHLGHDEK